MQPIKFTPIETTDSLSEFQCMDCVMNNRDPKATTRENGPQPQGAKYFLRDGPGGVNARPLCAWCANRNATFELLMGYEVEFGGQKLSLPLAF